ncbi:hypothetical protein AB7849_09350 [Rhodanobacter sp. 115]|uniref:hypothetical protein n=1 Tax=Rhodanobacter sp. FW021-MT20 TaxID=1162282 RepID=UPI0034E39A87
MNARPGAKLLVIDQGVSASSLMRPVYDAILQYMSHRRLRFIPSSRKKRIMRAAERGARFGGNGVNPLKF